MVTSRMIVWIQCMHAYAYMTHSNHRDWLCKDDCRRTVYIIYYIRIEFHQRTTAKNHRLKLQTIFIGSVSKKTTSVRIVVNVDRTSFPAWENKFPRIFAERAWAPPLCGVVAGRCRFAKCQKCSRVVILAGSQTRKMAPGVLRRWRRAPDWIINRMGAPRRRLRPLTPRTSSPGRRFGVVIANLNPTDPIRDPKVDWTRFRVWKSSTNRCSYVCSFSTCIHFQDNYTVGSKPVSQLALYEACIRFEFWAHYYHFFFF